MKEVIYAEKGLKLFFCDECGTTSATQDKPLDQEYVCAVDREGKIYHSRPPISIAERQVSFDHPGRNFFSLQLTDKTGLCMSFEIAQGVAQAIVGKPVHSKKGWLLVTDGKFGDEGKPIYEDRYDRLLYNENGISIHVNDENGIVAHHAPLGLAWLATLTFWITIIWMKFIGLRFSRLRKRLRTRRFRQAGPEFILTIGRWFVCISSATAAGLAAAISSKTNITKS